MSPKKLLATIALGTLMINPVYAADGSVGIYHMDDGSFSAFLYLAPTGRYYLGARIVIGTLGVINFNSTGAWRGKKGEICIEPSIAPYQVFAAKDRGKSDLPPNVVKVIVETLDAKATTFFSVGAEFPGRRTDNDPWPDDRRFRHQSNMSYQFVVKPHDAQGYLRVAYEDFDYVYSFPLNPKYNVYRVINGEQVGFDSTSMKVINAMILDYPLEEATSLDKIPSCGSLNKKYKRLPPEVSKAQKKEYMKNMVENIDPQKKIEDGVTYTRIPLRFLKAMPAPQEKFEE